MFSPVPELVPFRLTQNMFGALSFLETHGVFKKAGIATLDVLSKFKDYYFNMLEDFMDDQMVRQCVTNLR